MGDLYHSKTLVFFHTFTQELDYEVELAIIIGKSGYNFKVRTNCSILKTNRTFLTNGSYYLQPNISKEEEAMDYVFGYTVAHDVSARDWQLRKNNGLWSLGKTLDTFCPLGPAIVAKDSLSGGKILS